MCKTCKLKASRFHSYYTHSFTQICTCCGFTFAFLFYSGYDICEEINLTVLLWKGALLEMCRLEWYLEQRSLLCIFAPKQAADAQEA